MSGTNENAAKIANLVIKQCRIQRRRVCILVSCCTIGTRIDCAEWRVRGSMPRCRHRSANTWRSWYHWCSISWSGCRRSVLGTTEDTTIRPPGSPPHNAIFVLLRSPRVLPWFVREESCLPRGNVQIGSHSSESTYFHHLIWRILCENLRVDN